MVVVLVSSSSSFAEPLTGRVVDKTSGAPVAGAIVTVSGPSGLVGTLNTDGEGRYRTTVAPGTYDVIFAYGTTRATGKVVVAAERGATLDGKLDAMMGEVIVIRDKIAPPTPPKKPEINTPA